MYIGKMLSINCLNIFIKIISSMITTIVSFPRLHSVKLSAMELIDKILLVIDEKHMAFEAMDHNILLNSLQ